MHALGLPTLLCHHVEADAQGYLQGFRRCAVDHKRRVVLALRELGFRTVAAGDSHNDLGMLAAAHAGFLVDPPVAVAAPGQPLAAPT